PADRPPRPIPGRHRHVRPLAVPQRPSQVAEASPHLSPLEGESNETYARSALVAVRGGCAADSSLPSLRAQRSNPDCALPQLRMDCFVAALLAMTASGVCANAHQKLRHARACPEHPRLRVAASDAEQPLERRKKSNPQDKPEDDGETTPASPSSL